jgi:hypothetical protein
MLLNLLASIDYLAVVIAAVAGMVFGAIWYMPGVFGTLWRASLGNDRWHHADPREAVVVRALATGVTAFFLAVLIHGGGVTTFGGSLRLGAVVAIGVVSPTIIADYHFAGRQWRLTWLTVSHRIVHVILMAGVLGAFKEYAG